MTSRATGQARVPGVVPSPRKMDFLIQNMLS